LEKRARPSFCGRLLKTRPLNLSKTFLILSVKPTISKMEAKKPKSEQEARTNLSQKPLNQSLTVGSMTKNTTREATSIET